MSNPTNKMNEPVASSSGQAGPGPSQLRTFYNVSHPPTPTHAAMRRSPRTIAQFASGFRLETLDAKQTAIVISLCEVSGWSADHIAARVHNKFGVAVSGLGIYNLHQAWIHSKGGDDMVEMERENEDELIYYLLGSVGIFLARRGRSLGKTPAPAGIVFSRCWEPKATGVPPLCPYFEHANRDRTKIWLLENPSERNGQLSPFEVPAVEQFGPFHSAIIMQVFAHWDADMKALIAQHRPYQMIPHHKQINLILANLEIYHAEYQKVYGKMEDSRPLITENIPEGSICIKSTGYGGKVLLGLLMADRIAVFDTALSRKKKSICFLNVQRAFLSDHEKDCPICASEMGVSPGLGQEGEATLELVICCGVKIGADCLKAWLNTRIEGVYCRSCPHCRYIFPQNFIDKLMPRNVTAIEAGYFANAIELGFDGIGDERGAEYSIEGNGAQGIGFNAGGPAMTDPWVDVAITRGVVMGIAPARLEGDRRQHGFAPQRRRRDALPQSEVQPRTRRRLNPAPEFSASNHHAIRAWNAFRAQEREQIELSRLE